MASLWGVMLLVGWLGVAQSPTIDTSRVIGRITDQYGCPLEGAAVQARTLTGEVLAHDKTTQTGDFVLERLPKGAMEITAELNGFVRRQGSLTLKDRETVWDTSLPLGQLSPMPSHRVFGVVTTGSAPVADVTISLVTVFGARLVHQTRTDPRGRYSMALDDGGQYLLMASKGGFEGGSQQLRISGGPSEHPINFQPAHDIRV